MTPTPKLRFVERIVPLNEVTATRVRVLQQYYVPIGGDKTSDHYLGQWRDVPLEVEQ
jgi:hypothetical protein